jgi:hypothetical protein
MARSGAGSTERATWEPGGKLKAVYNFREGGRMAAEISERDLGSGAGKEVLWLGRSSDERDCAEQDRLVTDVVDHTEGMTKEGGRAIDPPDEERESPVEKAAREAG